MRFGFRLFLAGFLYCFSVAVCSVSARADVRALAPRPLGENSAFIEGTHAHFENGELNFVRSQNARLQLWRAFQANTDAKNPAWSTQAFSAQSPYLLDVLASQRAFSADGQTIAFVSQRGGQSAIYIVPASDFGRPERARRIVAQGQSPAFLDGSTLLFESTNPERPGLFRATILGDEKSRPAPQLLFSRGGESAVAPDGQTICVAAKNDNTQNNIADGNATQLYLLSLDGSGARAISQTAGARRPCFAIDGSAIFFDAPAPQADGNGAGSTPRVLWTVPLTNAPPTAQLFFVRPDKNGDVEIIGTLFSSDAGELQSEIEFWTGAETEFENRPQFALPVKTAPIHNAPLLTWPLPHRGTPQEWTLRLTTQDKAGQSAQSTLTFLWPPAQSPSPIPAITPQTPMVPIVEPVIATIAPTPIAPTPIVPTPVVAVAVIPVFPSPATISAPKINVAPATGNSNTLGDLPAPALPNAPENLPAIPPPAGNGPRSGSTPTRRAQAEPPPVRRNLPPAQRGNTPPKKVVKKPVTKKAAAPKPQPKPPTQKSGGIPSQVKVNSSTSVEVSLRNTGTRSWSSTGDAPVRLLIRWMRADSGIRYRWAVKWLRETVEPGQNTTVRFDLEAPNAPGRYILTYALVRLSPEIYDGKSYKPPPAKAADQRWPGEFGAVSYEILVK